MAQPDGLRNQDVIDALNLQLQMINEKTDAIQREVVINDSDRNLLGQAEERVRATLDSKAQEAVIQMTKNADGFDHYNRLEGYNDEQKAQSWLKEIGAKTVKIEDLPIVKLGGISILQEVRQKIDPGQEQIREEEWDNLLMAIIVANQLSKFDSPSLQLKKEGVTYPDLQAAEALEELLENIRELSDDEIQERLITVSNHMLAMIGGNDQAYELQKQDKRVYILGEDDFASGRQWVDRITAETKDDFPQDQIVDLDTMWLDNLSDIDPSFRVS